MSATKLVNNKRRNHAQKVLQQMSKNLNSESSHSHEKDAVSGESSASVDPEMELKNHYDVIRQDLMKLREDLSHGYDLARNYIEKIEPVTLVKGLLKAI